jgi:hypothetical protein
MKRVCAFTALIVTVVLFASCREVDIRKVVVKAPGLKNPACAKVIQDAFMKQPGIVSIQPDFQKRELTVTYNSMVIAIKNIEFTIAEAGFDANGEKARTNAVAVLPPECR